MRRTILVGFAALALAAGCSGEPCGTSSPAEAVVELVSVGGEVYSYGGFVAGENNDCPPDGAGPEAPVSVSILGEQTGSGFAFVLCIREPQRIAHAPAPLDLADTAMFTLFDVNARRADGCDYRLFPTAVPTGTASFDGFCTRAGAKYNMTLAGQVQGIRRCPVDGGAPMEEIVMLELGGTVVVRMESNAGQQW